MGNTLEKVRLGEYITDFVCPICCGKLRLAGFHIDGRLDDLLVNCFECGFSTNTDETGFGLKSIK